MSRPVPRRGDRLPWSRSTCRAARRGRNPVRLSCPPFCTLDHAEDDPTACSVEHSMEFNSSVWLVVIDDRVTGVRGEATIEVLGCDGVDSAEARCIGQSLFAAADARDGYRQAGGR